MHGREANLVPFAKHIIPCNLRHLESIRHDEEVPIIGLRAGNTAAWPRPSTLALEYMLSLGGQTSSEYK